MDRIDATGYLAPPGMEEPLLEELGSGILAVHGPLALAAGPPREVRWVQNVWRSPVRIPIRSIGDGARKLRDIQRNWALLPLGNHRRAALIQEALPHVSAKPLRFPAPPPSAPLGSWALIEPGLILASADCSSPFPNGEARFIEPAEGEGPPNRAFLKLWEALTILGRRPGPGERCLDAGASPGGWTWVLASLGARVLAVDKAPLDPSVAAMPGVECRQASAFSIQPPDGPFDWILSDVICYPDRLWTWVERWLRSGRAKNFLCTVKFQGAGNHSAIEPFAAVPGSRVVHLSCNKHELTWMRVAAP